MGRNHLLCILTIFHNFKNIQIDVQHTDSLQYTCCRIDCAFRQGQAIDFVYSAVYEPQAIIVGSKISIVDKSSIKRGILLGV